MKSTVLTLAVLLGTASFVLAAGQDTTTPSTDEVAVTQEEIVINKDGSQAGEPTSTEQGSENAQ